MGCNGKIQYSNGNVIVFDIKFSSEIEIQPCTTNGTEYMMSESWSQVKQKHIL